MTMIQNLRMALIISVLALLVGCSSSGDGYLPDKSVEYKREKQAERNLEIPPDLTSTRVNDRMSVPENYAGVATNYTEYVTDRRLRGVENRAAASNQVLPQNPDIRIERDQDSRWLTIDAPADAVWDRVLDFWQDQGILLLEQDPELGIMRTNWLDNRANISRDFLTDAIRSVFDGLYETSLRDQYRVRFERTGEQKTEVYLTHYGMEEKLQANTTGQADNTIWTPRPRDPELEIVMLRRMTAFLGAAEERSQAQVAARGGDKLRSQLVQGDQTIKLKVEEEFVRSWRLVGLALDRVGFAVEDRDRTAGIYYVRYNDPAAQEEGGFLSALKFWDDDETASNQYQIKLEEDGGNTIVSVLDEQGNPNASNTARRILNLVNEQIR